MIPRRQFLQSLAVAATAPWVARAAKEEPFRLRYVLSSALYGEMPLDVILPEVTKTGCEAIDVWCRPHGNQREQIVEMGDDAFVALLAKHRAKLGVSTRYPLGPLGLGDEMMWMKKMGGGIIVTGSGGPKGLAVSELKKAIQGFFERMKPHVAAAEVNGVTIAIENHSNSLLHHPDSLRYFSEFNRSSHLGVALAPHHLHPWIEQLPALIRDLGAKQIPFMYFQEHSEGIAKKVAKEIELRQLPGFGGGLDYRPVIKALADIRYRGLVEIFMHPTPRGIPILPTVPEITAAINRSRDYIERCRREVVA
ncbi:MAG: sugar phosphate isomerase/epimerase [Opitutaceae bacterium]|nr:sugar phosphate isomerase/epimerase [Opitutaceae bacterium]